MSRTSSSFLIDWHPSRLLLAARVLVCLLAVLSLWLSALPVAAAIPLSALVLALSAWRIGREARRPAVSLRIADDGAWVVLLRPQTRPLLLRQAQVAVRGPLAWVRARDASGARWSWSWWPDSLQSGDLRKLRLACGGPNAKSAPSLATMQG